jgi:TolB-like protein/DNA-binding winged helix-turn-helix (wHTH) protein/Tfp pilus assembly protein PilF
LTSPDVSNSRGLRAFEDKGINLATRKVGNVLLDYRHCGWGTAAVSENATRLVQFGIFEVDLRAGELRRNGSKVKLQEQPFQVLCLLLQYPGEVVTREELKKKLWPADTFVDFDHGLNAAIRRLRDALGDSAENPRFVETVARRGYRFLPPINGADAGPLTVAEEAKHRAEMPGKAQGVHGPRAPGAGRWLALCGIFFLALLAVAGFSLRSRTDGATPPKIKSLAVLPLKNLSGDPALEYFADGMTEEVIGRLSTIRGLRVISRTSVMRFKDVHMPVPEIAKELGVDAVVEGSLMRVGERVRVHAQLIRGRSDDHFWSETYDRELGDVLVLESDVAQAIAARVQVTVTRAERARLTAARQVLPEVYESYLKGQFNRGYNLGDMRKSIAYFEEAIRKDPSFAPAYIGLADRYDQLSTPGIGGAPPNDLRPKVLSLIRKGLELDPALPQAHALLANVYQGQWQWNDAESEYKLALELNPNDAAAHLGYALWLVCQGRTEEALAWSQRARGLDPLGVTGNNIGWLLFQSRRYDDAIRELRSDLVVRPDDASTHWFLGFALIANGQANEAVPVLEKSLALSERSPAVIGVLVRAYAHAGRRPDALGLLKELEQRQQEGYVPAAAFVNAYLGLGDHEQSIAWLERAYQEQSMILQFLRVHPFLDPLRNDPRFADLVRQVGLEKPRQPRLTL